MLCSIIIPLYNKELYITKAINSILAQTYTHFEIIIINDGSTDQSAEQVEAINDDRIRLINQQNNGVSRARNRGIDEAKGQLIFFLDADDWYHKDYLKTVVLMAKTYSSGSFFATDFKTVANHQSEEWDATEADVNPIEIITDFYHHRLVKGTFFCTDTVAVWRHDLLPLQPCFPLDESLGEDQELWFRLAERLDIVYCPEKLAAYRIEVAGSLCTKQPLATLPHVYTRLEERAKQGLLKKESRYSALVLVAYERISVARYLLAKGKRRAAFAELRKGFRGVVLKRWWMTLLLCCFGSPLMMTSWEKQRPI